MYKALNRLLLWPALGISIFLWLGMSSVFANAIHVLVKANFSPSGAFGSISLWWLLLAISWPFIAGYVLSAAMAISFRNLIRGACAVGLWVIFMAISISLAERFLENLNYMEVMVCSVTIVIVEVSLAFFLVKSTSRLGNEANSFYVILSQTTAAFVWLMAAKALLLCLSPGVSIRSI